MTRTGRRISGFTLIELMAVVTILGLLTGAVSMSMHAQANAARLRLDVDRLRSFDAAVRNLASKTGRGEIVVNTSTDAVWFEPEDGARREMERFVSSDLRGVRVPTHASRSRVQVTSLGVTPTYAFELIDRSNPRQATFVAFAGGTGHCIELASLRELRALSH
ncbi:MAG: prepilin-type N-terminal cleavage/methylation domain-containing protein [Planctomycetota bacterium]